MQAVNNWWKTLADNHETVVKIIQEYAVDELIRFDERFNNHDKDVWYCMQTAFDVMMDKYWEHGRPLGTDTFCRLCCEGWILFEEYTKNENNVV